MRYLDLIRERPELEQKPAQANLNVVSQRGELDPNAFLEEPLLKSDTPAPTYIHQTIATEVIPKGSQTSAKTTPFEVGDRIVYRVPGDSEEGPFEVTMVSPDNHKRGWWAVITKPTGWAYIHQILVEQIIPPKPQTP